MSLVIDIPITSSWVDINTYSGIPVGIAFQAVNGSGVGMLITENPLEPNEKEGFPLTTLSKGAGIANILEGSDRIWIKTSSELTGVHVSVQEL